MKINDLIADNKLDEAAVEICEAFRFMLNASGMRIQLSKDEFYKVLPNVLEIMSDGLPESEDTTDTPGDDITVNPATATLTVEFEGPEDDKGWKKLPDYTSTYAVGATYYFAPYTVVGYTASENLVTGTMTAAGVTKTITYTKDAEETEEESSEETTKATLKITYVGPSGDTEFTAPAAVNREVTIGESYSVTSPTVTGYTPDKATVTGTMTSSGVTETVTYSKV